MLGDALLYLEIESSLVGFRHFISTRERVILSMVVLDDVELFACHILQAQITSIVWEFRSERCDGI